MHQHRFYPSTHKGYEVCECGTYHSTQLLPREEVYENNYWNGDTRSLLKDQVINLTEENTCGISKIDKVLSYIGTGDVLEIACAPGILMNKLWEKGNYVVGIEPDAKNISEIKRIAGEMPHIIQGYFPECLMGKSAFPFQYVIALDVVEHIEYYELFIKAAHYHLKPGGKFIFMSPIILNDGLYRFKDFVPAEHAHIFSKRYLKEFLGSIFSEVIFDRWKIGHEMVIAVK